jgi:hypothetical protein
MRKHYIGIKAIVPVEDDIIIGIEYPVSGYS